ncbi:MAG: FAD-binding protein [Proteobacteria bacterium]|jgi:D-lactate dehydrogenase (cytochrome)|nr:FAD-binding protein [Pseudomonadota bacterium]
MNNSETITILKELLGEKLTTSTSDRDIHGRSEAYFPHMPPDAVIYPETAEDISNILEICSKFNCPVIPWGTGTSLEGHSLAINGGVTVDLTKMKNVLSIDQEDMVAVVQPGITRMELNEQLKSTGLFFSVDPGADASIGGMASTRASGTTTVKYGTMADNVLAMQVILADGRTIRTGSKARKSSAGYDLTRLFIGSEGTLGIITELTLKLVGTPEKISAAVCSFSSISAAVETAILTIQMCIPIARIEFVDIATVKAFNLYSGTKMPELPHLLIEFHGSKLEVEDQSNRFGEIVLQMGGSDFTWSTKQEERSKLWQVRHDAYHAILASKPGFTALVTDVCVPISKLAQALQETVDEISKSNISGPILGHLGDGNFHSVLLIDPNNPDDLVEAKRLSDSMTKRALTFDGTVTGEHGIGMGKIPYMKLEHGLAWDLMSEIKKGLDPNNILNPGKMFLTD